MAEHRIKYFIQKMIQPVLRLWQRVKARTVNGRMVQLLRYMRGEVNKQLPGWKRDFSEFSAAF